MLEIGTLKTEFIIIRDVGSTHVPRLDDQAPEVWRDNHGAVCARATLLEGRAWMDFPGIATFRFDPTNWEVTAFASAEVDLELVRDTYYRAAIPHALNFFGREVLHASAVRTEHGVVAFCAVSETGKSTTAAAFSLRGYPMWADDAVLIETGETDQATRTFFLPFRLRLWPASADFLDYSDKREGWPSADSTGQVSAPLAALCVLTRSDEAAREVEIRLLSRAEAFTALVPHAYCFSLSNLEKKRQMMRHYLDLAGRTPTFAVSMMSGMQRLSQVIDAIEKTLPAFARSSH